MCDSLFRDDAKMQSVVSLAQGECSVNRTGSEGGRGSTRTFCEMSKTYQQQYDCCLSLLGLLAKIKV